MAIDLNHVRFLEVDMPGLFRLEVLHDTGSWIEEAVCEAEEFARQPNGAYLRAGLGYSPLWIRSVANLGTSFIHVDGGGLPHRYRLVPLPIEIVDPPAHRLNPEQLGEIVTESINVWLGAAADNALMPDGNSNAAEFAEIAGGLLFGGEFAWVLEVRAVSVRNLERVGTGLPITYSARVEFGCQTHQSAEGLGLDVVMEAALPGDEPGIRIMAMAVAS